MTITAEPDSGYQLDKITAVDASGKELELKDLGGRYSFAMPGGAVEIKADFIKKAETSPFQDVSTDADYYDAVKWAAEKSVTAGVGGGLFGPDESCTRAQAVTFLYRICAAA